MHCPFALLRPSFAKPINCKLNPSIALPLLCLLADIFNYTKLRFLLLLLFFLILRRMGKNKWGVFLRQPLLFFFLRPFLEMTDMLTKTCERNNSSWIS